MIVWVLSNGADITTTEMALNTGYTREVNPLLTRRSVRIPLKVGVTAVGVYGIKKYPKSKNAKIAVYIISSVYIGVSINNYRIYRNVRR